MTALNFTISPVTAWVSSDSLWQELLSGSMPAFHVSSDGEAGLANLAAPAVPLQTRDAFHDGKFVVLARARALVAGTGYAGPMLRWRDELLELDPGSVEEIVDIAPARLAALLAADEHKARFSCMVAVVGWSEVQRRVVGWSLASTDGFKPAALPEGHSFAPPPACDEAESQVLMPMFDTAAKGESIADFHLSLLRSQARASRAGGYMGGAMRIGGMGYLAEISEAGINTRELGRLEAAPRDIAGAMRAWAEGPGSSPYLRS